MRLSDWRNRRRDDGKISEWREDPTTTERTLAAFVSGASTRILIERESRIGGCNGMYIPDEDRILLFRCEGGVPAVSVALEEAGHSQARDVYLRTKVRTVQLRERLAQVDALAPYLIDWYEDGRIYEWLKSEYPGARRELDYVWDLREKQVTTIAFDTAKSPVEARIKVSGQKWVVEEFIKSVERYKAGNSFKTFEDILTYLEKFVQGSPKHQQPQPEGLIIPGRDSDQTKQVDRKKYNVVRAGDDLVETAKTMTVVIELDATNAGIEAAGAEYPWHVIRQDVIDGSDWS